MKLTVDELYAKYMTAKQEVNAATARYTGILGKGTVVRERMALRDVLGAEQVMRNAWHDWQKVKHGPKWGMQ